MTLMVRLGSVVIVGTTLDFYPEIEVRFEDRRKVYMVDDQDEVLVYKSDFKAK
jgi:hypothetical protein